MTNQWVVGLGLLIDAVGALGVVVPDLPRTWRVWIIRRTPVFRQYWRSAWSFMTGEPYDVSIETMDEAEVMEHLRTIWPAIQDNSGFLRDIPFDDVEFVEADSPRITIQYTHHERGEDERRLNINDLNDWADDYIDKSFRILGWLLLIAGFLIQFLGIFL